MYFRIFLSSQIVPARNQKLSVFFFVVPFPGMLNNITRWIQNCVIFIWSGSGLSLFLFFSARSSFQPVRRRNRLEKLPMLVFLVLPCSTKPKIKYFINKFSCHCSIRLSPSRSLSFPAKHFKSFEFFAHFWCFFFCALSCWYDNEAKKRKKASSSTKLKNNETSKEKKTRISGHRNGGK